MHLGSFEDGAALAAPLFVKTVRVLAVLLSHRIVCTEQKDRQLSRLDGPAIDIRDSAMRATRTEIAGHSASLAALQILDCQQE